MFVAAVPAVNAQVDPVPGSLDLSFALGNGKIPSLSFSSPEGTDDRARAVAVQADGRIVLAGACGGSVQEFCLARLNSDGTLDGTFVGPGANGDGRIRFKFLSTNGIPFGGNLSAMVIQPDGKIVTAGSCLSDFCIARLNPSDGGFDTTFDGDSGTANGRLWFPVGASVDEATSIALMPDGRIVVAGMCSNGANNDFCVVRLLSSGAFDTSFGATGKILVEVGALGDRAQAVATQPDGKIVIGGYCNNGSNFDFCLVRLNVNGSLDTTFNADGKVVIAASGNQSTNALIIQPDGRILAAGDCEGLFCAIRLNADGSLDAMFNGPSGTAGGFFTEGIGPFYSKAFALTQQTDGKFILAGECEVTSGGQRDFCIARFNPDGSFDRTFDGPNSGSPANGRFLIPIRTTSGQEYDDAAAVTVQRDGKIIVAGACGALSDRDFCVARLHGGPFTARQCSMDIDGDGKVTATVDSLIHARVALGITGNAVVSGVTFAAHATRPSWSLIRNYLTTQCGMAIP